VDVRVARLHGSARQVASRSGVLSDIGDDHVHLTVAEAVDAAVTEMSEEASGKLSEEGATDPGDGSS
jgi:hypothetical protein